MKTVKQLLRQPLKTLFGVILIAIAVAVLCVCLGQSIAARETEERLNEVFQTAAFPAGAYQTGNGEWVLPSEGKKWMDSYAPEHPEVVKTISMPGLASAYAPSLTPDNMTEHYRQSDYWFYTVAPQNCAILEITLTEIGEPVQSEHLAMGKYYLQSGITVELTGIVDRIVALQEDYPDCTGFFARMNLILPDTQALEDLDLTIGERYLIYCSDYVDQDYLMRRGLCWDLELDLKQWHDFEKIEFFTEEELPDHNTGIYYAERIGRVRIGSHVTYVYDYHEKMYLSVSGNLYDSSALLGAGYATPSIAHLTGTAEEFLASDRGVLWREALHNVQVTNQAFPVVGVDNLNYISDFMRGLARISEGRTFTREEMESGERVCIISETVAEKNGLQVGDAIELQFYGNDENLPHQSNSDTNPTASYYFAKTTPLQEPQQFLIVGFYERQVDWCASAENYYAFTPNTVFTPKTALDMNLEYGDSGFFITYVLQNGAAEEFRAAAASQGLGDLFIYYDNGFSAVEEMLGAYQDVAVRAMIVGCVTYAVILLVFLVLYPVQQKKTLATMESLGANRHKRICHVLAGGACILLTGTVVGIAVGMLMWQRVTEFLTMDMMIPVSLEIDMAVLAEIALLQTIGIMLCMYGISLAMTKSKSLMYRK